MAVIVALARQRIEAFAQAHRIVFEDQGEIGIMRPCVGLRHGDHHIAYRPTRYVYASPFDINISDIVRIPGFEDDRVYPPDSVTDAYHKDECIAVLVQGERDDTTGRPVQAAYDAAILQLADWVAHLDALGVEIVPYPTGAQGLQMMMSGITGMAVRVIPK
jgi:hypothetical protein